MISRNNKRTRNKKNKSGNKRNTHKKSMNRYKRSLKKKKSRRNYKKRTINKKLQRGGVIELSTPVKVDGKQLTLEETFGKKERQFYNAAIYCYKNGVAKIPDDSYLPYSLRMRDLRNSQESRSSQIDSINTKLQTVRRVDVGTLMGWWSDLGGKAGEMVNIAKVTGRLHNKLKGELNSIENENGCVKLGFGRHSESEANWMIPPELGKIYGFKYELYYGYVTPFLTPYGRALAYSTGYYEYGDHILMTGENLEFYSSTLPRSMITAMLMLRGVIQRLKDIKANEGIVSEDDKARMVKKGSDEEEFPVEWMEGFMGRKLDDLIELYSSKIVRVVYGCSEIPEKVPGATENFYTNNNTPFAGERDSYVQRIMKAEMLQPLMEFINETESGNTGIKLVLDESREQHRPYLWRDGDPGGYYHSDDETLDRFFYELSKIPVGKRLGDTDASPPVDDYPGGVRHMFIVHGILMEKYISWPFFLEYFSSMFNEGSGQRGGGDDEWENLERSTEPEPEPQPGQQSGQQSEIPVTKDELKGHIESVMDKLLQKLLPSVPASEEGGPVPMDSTILHQVLSQVLFWGGFELGTIKHMIKGMGTSDESIMRKLEELEVSYNYLINNRLQNGITLKKETDEAVVGLNNILKEIGDPRHTGHEWFRTFLVQERDKVDGLKKERETPGETLFRILMEEPLNKTPFNCSTVMATFIGPRLDELGNSKDSETSKKRDDARNLYLSYCCYDVKFLAPSVRLRKCPTATAHDAKTNYSELLSVLQNNRPDLTIQTDGFIMGLLLNGPIAFQGVVRKQKPTLTTQWELRHLIIRGNGIYFHDIIEGGFNPIPRGSSCHDIRGATVTKFYEKYTIMAGRDWSGEHPSIMVTFPNNKYIGTDNKEINGEMKFSFLEGGQRDDCLQHLKLITGQLPEGEVAREGLESALMDEVVLINEVGDNASEPIVARGYIYKKGQGLKAYSWPRLYVVLKGNGIYFYESEEKFLEENSGEGHTLFIGEDRIGNEHLPEESRIPLKGFRGSSTHDISTGDLQSIEIEKTMGTGGNLFRPKIEIKFNPPYTSADPSKGSGDFRSDEIIFSVLGYHDTPYEAGKNSEKAYINLPDTKGELKMWGEGGALVPFENPPFFVLLYNGINRIINSKKPDAVQGLKTESA